jgi:LPXTG-site transpeptidase (sortase) family protein
MRLRFGKPSLPLLMFFAALIGIIFYIVDNRNNISPVTSTQFVPTEVALDEPTQVAAQATVFPSLSESLNPSRIITRQEIPQTSSIFIPTAGVISNIVQTYLDGSSWDISQLRSNVGHLEGTPWVDQPGNAVLSGHVELADGRPGIFAELNLVQVNDLVIVQSNGNEYTYIVTEIYSTTPNDLVPLMPTPEDRLTLITCSGYDFFSNTYQERDIVVAERMG